MVSVLILTDRSLQPHRDIKSKPEIAVPGVIGIAEQVILLDDVLVIGHKDPE